MADKKVALIILDGWGLGSDIHRDAIKAAKTPFFDYLLETYPNNTLKTFGEHVGLPFGQMGNSEVGHLNIGAGRVVFQELLKINNAVADGTLKAARELNLLFEYCKQHSKPFHLMGLVSDGGVHSHTDHAIAICKYAYEFGLKEIYVHAFTDGRDTGPNNGVGYLSRLIDSIKPFGAKVVSICGRYYAMDRDKRWERVKKAYDLLVKGEGKPSDDIVEAVRESYGNGITDEFILPIMDQNNFKAISTQDAVLCFNFRTDRCREITQVLTQKSIEEFDMKPLELYYATMTIYDETFVKVHTIFSNDNLTNTLGEVLAANGKTQLRAAETEKYPHVTFFFNGGREDVFAHEHRIMASSPKVATYDLKPEMSAPELTEKVDAYVVSYQPDFICLNYANTDMVGHTGVFSAAIKAAETVDGCLKKMVERLSSLNYTILITADHGNADNMINEDGTVNTAHSKNPVPIILVDKHLKPEIKNGKLADLAPTILKIMQIEKPADMTGEELF
jgi:2,3-bisphosphoglycerate-independent phosphoglycerate mutase